MRSSLLSSLAAGRGGRFRLPAAAAGIIAAVAVSISAPAWAGTATWDASTSLLPSQATPPWTFSTGATPALVSGYLNLTPSTRGDYVQSGPSQIVMPSVLVISADMQLISGSTSDNSRAPAEIGWTSTANVGNSLNIGLSGIFLNTGDASRGAIAAVDTTGDFHNYRVEVTIATGQINVFYDNGATPVLTGNNFSSAAFNGSALRVRFGGGSSLATGTSHWLDVSQNASVISTPTAAAPEPGSLVLAALPGFLAAGSAMRRRRA